MDTTTYPVRATQLDAVIVGVEDPAARGVEWVRDRTLVQGDVRVGCILDRKRERRHGGKQKDEGAGEHVEEDASDGGRALSRSARGPPPSLYL
jgi:hypothetical protein